jgi:hypothetical protein
LGKEYVNKAAAARSRGKQRHRQTVSSSSREIDYRMCVFRLRVRAERVFGIFDDNV